jgi:hypothetical protein
MTDQSPQTRALDLYLSILEELKGRIACINLILTSSTGLPERPAIELGYLQLRMMCELTAVGCIVVHGGVEGVNGLRKIWAADEIMKRLEKLHPDFYPHPILLSFPKPGHVHADTVTDGFLKKDELIRLVGLCGDVLHRGSLKNFLSPNTTLDRGLDGVREWGQKLVTLLSQHRIGLVGGTENPVCVLQDGFGRVSVNRTEKIRDL